MPDTFFHRNEWFKVVECRSCGIVFVNPPGFDEMCDFIPAFYDYF